jgi:NADP-dependent 3-hydroxy acid dehydrogenase YdfG
MSLENRVVVMTGGTGILGRFVAQSFADQGARLALIGSDADRLEQLSKQLNLGSDRWLLHVSNLRHPSSAHSRKP